LTDYNGVDVNQTAEYIEITASGYIDQVLQSDGWDTPSPREYCDEKTAPLPDDAVDRLYKSHPMESTSENASLCASHGLSYRTLLGELLYA
jgi:hypothetical protein